MNADCCSTDINTSTYTQSACCITIITLSTHKKTENNQTHNKD